MALVDITISATTEVVAIRANNAAEMASKIAEYQANAPDPLNIYDIQLVGGGAAPNFLCNITVGAPGGSAITFGVTEGRFVALGGTAEDLDPVALAEKISTLIQNEPDVSEVAKIEIATGGVGPHWMAVALLLIND